MIDSVEILSVELDLLEMLYYINPEGKFLGAANGENPYGDDAISISPAPAYGDQVWLFSDSEPYWTESPSLLIRIESQWRDEQMERVANQLLMIEDDDPDKEAGTDRQWRDYRIALRRWVDGGDVNFPNKEYRPKDPT